MGKAIYQPSGKAQEYNQWAVNFYNGCSGKCTYCYNKKGRSSKLLGKETPTLKSTLKNPETALSIFKKEAIQNLTQLRKNGLFFNFVSDPFLPETILLNTQAMRGCLIYDISIIALTKQTKWVEPFLNELLVNKTIWNCEAKTHLFNLGFTLTGHDELEEGCSTNAERIWSMKKLHESGFKTWASIEPVIYCASSLKMIQQSLPYCNHYKIGLESGKKYKPQEVRNFFYDVLMLIYEENKKRKVTMYFKESIRKVLNKNSFEDSFCVDANYKFWKKC